jgi:hypothetical protein
MRSNLFWREADIQRAKTHPLKIAKGTPPAVTRKALR